jgi:hypothetical protein
MGIMIAYILTGIISLAFIGGWLLLDRSISWTFGVSLLMYLPAIYSLFIKDWRNFIIFGICFIVLVHLYLYDKYFTYYKVTKRGRR